MPSSHSAVVTSLATMVGKSEGLNSPMFGIATIFAFVVMYDATGVRRAAGKQAKILNKIVNTPGLTKEQVSEKLVETLGHTPVQVFVWSSDRNNIRFNVLICPHCDKFFVGGYYGGYRNSKKMQSWRILLKLLRS